jgi:CMP-N-acetylneuraminic acid synthetase
LETLFPRWMRIICHRFEPPRSAVTDVLPITDLTRNARGYVTAIIPARGGSKGIPGKNMRQVGGRSLVERAVDAALQSTFIDEVIVSTDDRAIAQAAVAAGASVVPRPVDIAGDTASSESALVHALSELSQIPQVTVFMQATSPFIDPADLDAAVEAVVSGRAEVAFSVTRSHEFLWRVGPDGAFGVNHDASVRERRQDRPSEYRETGAFYAMDTAGFLERQHRFFGRIELIEVDGADSLEIDDPFQLQLADAMAHARLLPLKNRK